MKFSKLRETRERQAAERRRFEAILRPETHDSNSEDESNGSPPPYSSAPTLDELERSPTYEDSKLRAPLRSSSISNPAQLYPSLSHADISATRSKPMIPLCESQIYTTYHDYILPPFECQKKKRPEVLYPIEDKKHVTVKKSTQEVFRPSWVNRVIFGQPTLLITKRVSLKVPADRKAEFEKFTYHQLKKFKGAKESDKVTIFNPMKSQSGKIR